MKLTKQNTAQRVLLSEFTFNFDDTLGDAAGALASLGAAGVFPIIKLPSDAVIVGGDLTVLTAGATATAWTFSLGDDSGATKYLAATSLLSAARTALTLTGQPVNGDLKATIAATGSPSAGRASLRVMFIVPGKADVVNG
jgi:hypothetical protein